MNDSLRIQPRRTRVTRRFILNVGAKVVHDRHNLREDCNTDQIEKRRNSDNYPKSYRPCEHCMVPE